MMRLRSVQQIVLGHYRWAIAVHAFAVAVSTVVMIAGLVLGPRWLVALTAACFGFTLATAGWGIRSIVNSYLETYNNFANR
jgi:putative Mn2+ efflux pump MntP